MIIQLGKNDVVRVARANAGLTSSQEETTHVDEEFLAACLRRVAGFHCPCSRSTLRTVLLECTSVLVSDEAALSATIDRAIEATYVAGDLLELSQVAVADDMTPGTWVFAAPPSFVSRSEGVFHIFGLGTEDPTPLPSALRTRLRQVGANRLLEAEPGEDTRTMLLDAGFREQSIDVWLKLPKKESPREYLKRVTSLLSAKGSCGEIEQLRIFDADQQARSYRQKWVQPAHQTGRFVCRRAQAFGTNLWGYVELSDGKPMRLMDLPMTGSRYRGCDDGWRLQMAIDAASGHPQRYSLREVDAGAALAFDFPLPMWVTRRLETVGRRVANSEALLEYLVPPRFVPEEIQYLQNALGLVSTS